MSVNELMSRDPITVHADAALREVMQIMNDNDFRHVPVVDHADRLLGMVSDRDIRSLALPALAAFSDPDQERQMLKIQMVEVMQTDVIAVNAEADVGEVIKVIEVMLDHKVGAVPVVDPGTERLVGIASYEDVLRAAQELF